MKALILCLLLLSSALGLAEETKSLRLLSYNIHAGIGVDRKFDLERIAAVIQSADAHVVALQEVDRETTRSRGIDIAERLGELTGMRAIFGASIEYQGGQFGNAILSNLEVEHWEVIPIPEVIAVEKRSVLSATLKFHGETIQVLGTHFCHRKPENRLLATELIVDRVAESNLRTFLVGDLNALPDSAPLQLLFTNGWENPSDEPVLTAPVPTATRQIDYVLSRTPDNLPPLTVKEVTVLPEDVASDHFPLLVEYAWP